MCLTFTVSSGARRGPNDVDWDLHSIFGYCNRVFLQQDTCCNKALVATDSEGKQF